MTMTRAVNFKIRKNQEQGEVNSKLSNEKKSLEKNRHSLNPTECAKA